MMISNQKIRFYKGINKIDINTLNIKSKKMNSKLYKNRIFFLKMKTIHQI